MRVALHPEARSELRSAALWYDERQAGLGDQFVGRISDLIERLAASPEAYPIWPGAPAASTSIRKAHAEQFPYLVAFEVHSEHLLILAVAHAKRRPLYWLVRATRESG